VIVEHGPTSVDEATADRAKPQRLGRSTDRQSVATSSHHGRGSRETGPPARPLAQHGSLRACEPSHGRPRHCGHRRRARLDRSGAGFRPQKSGGHVGPTRRPTREFSTVPHSGFDRAYEPCPGGRTAIRPEEGRAESAHGIEERPQRAPEAGKIRRTTSGRLSRPHQRELRRFRNGRARNCSTSYPHTKIANSGLQADRDRLHRARTGRAGTCKATPSGAATARPSQEIAFGPTGLRGAGL